MTRANRSERTISVVEFGFMVATSNPVQETIDLLLQVRQYMDIGLGPSERDQVEGIMQRLFTPPNHGGKQ